MKLLLCSEAFHTANTVQACADLVGKPKEEVSVAIINEAYAVEASDKYWTIANLHNAASNFRGGLDLINLLALPIEEVEARIMQKDALFVVGGNMDYLMHVFVNSGFAKLLPKILASKVYVGSSAGSIILSKHLPASAYAAIYGERNKKWLTDTYLDILDFAFLSHLNSSNFPENRSDVLQTVCAGLDFPVHSLQDDSAIVIDGDSMRFIGSDPVTIPAYVKTES